MLRLLDEVKRIIRCKTQDEWKAFFATLIFDGRTFVRRNGEKAAVAAFVLGIFIVLFFKLFILVLTLGALAYLVIISAADHDGPPRT